MTPIKMKTVGEIITENFLAADVLYKHGIDLFNQETKTLAEACQKQALNLRHIEKEIRETEGHRSYHYDKWELDYLIDHILNTHHYFIWINLPVIKEYALKVARAQGSKYPVTVEVNRLFKELAADMEFHLDNQEHNIFPYIKKMVYADRDGNKVDTENLELAVVTMKAECKCYAAKLNLMESLLRTADIANQPETTASVLLHKLSAFKHDFYQHTHLEKNILFPKALKLEKKLRDMENEGSREVGNQWMKYEVIRGR